MQRTEQSGGAGGGERASGRIQNNERRLKFSNNYHPQKVKEFHVYNTKGCFTKELLKQKKKSRKLEVY